MLGIRNVAPTTAAVIPTSLTSTRTEGIRVDTAPAAVKMTADTAITAPIAPAERPLSARTSGASRPQTPPQPRAGR